MLEISCSGTPYQIGFQHGSQAKLQIHGSIEFYTKYFFKNSKMSWADAESAAQKFQPFLEQHVPHFIEEMKGIASGANVSFLSILTLNSRTEVAMGMMNDGCTSLAWKTDIFSIAGQNWDWDAPQKDRLVLLHIKPESEGTIQRPRVSLVTEAGLLAKTGLNSSGVAVLMNAIRARGVKFDALPMHVAIRSVLDCQTRIEAVERLRSFRFGTAGHIMIADKTGATSLEFTHLDVAQLEMVDGQIAHTNHFLVSHDSGVTDTFIFPDSKQRVQRINKLLNEGVRKVKDGMRAFAACEEMLLDEDGLPLAINRVRSPTNESETLYSIMVDLNEKEASVKLGRPSQPEQIWTLRPAEL